MITIKFADRDTMKRALGFLAGRFSGRALRSGEVIIPEEALGPLAAQNYSFTVIGRATYDQMAPVRGDGAGPVQ